MDLSTGSVFNSVTNNSAAPDFIRQAIDYQSQWSLGPPAPVGFISRRTHTNAPTDALTVAAHKMQLTDLIIIKSLQENHTVSRQLLVVTEELYILITLY